MTYEQEGIIVEIIVREGSGAKIESYKVQIKDQQKTRSILYMLKKKYGFNDFFKRDKDIGWLDKGRF